MTDLHKGFMKGQNMRVRCTGLVVWPLLLGLVASSTAAENEGKPTTIPDVRVAFILGADISWVQQQEDEGVCFADHGVLKDILAILKDHGFNWIRLRVFHNPKAEKGYSRKGYCDLDHTLAMAKRIKAAGMRFLLDFHYSDTWADPGHQIKPAAWKDLHGAELEKAVHDYTRDVVAALKQQGTPPDIVQIGNEISNGFLWPDGNVWKSGKWDVFCGLIKAGIAGAKEADPSVKIMLHLAWGGQNAQSRSFWTRLLPRASSSTSSGSPTIPSGTGRWTTSKRTSPIWLVAISRTSWSWSIRFPTCGRSTTSCMDFPAAKGLARSFGSRRNGRGQPCSTAKGTRSPRSTCTPGWLRTTARGNAEPCSPFHGLALISTDCRPETCWKITCRNNSRKSENDTCHAPTA